MIGSKTAFIYKTLKSTNVFVYDNRNDSDLYTYSSIVRILHRRGVKYKLNYEFLFSFC